MITTRYCVIVVLITFKIITTTAFTSFTKSKGKTDDAPVFLTNYIPASMQVIFHLTDLMKYDLRPEPAQPQNPSTTTLRPTPPHKPGYFAPEVPPKEEQRTFDKWTSSWGFRNQHSTTTQSSQLSTLPPDIDLFGAGPSDLLYQINALEDFDTIDDEDQVFRFTNNYDDKSFSIDFLKKKRTPPTRAYVTMLSLYDYLNKEAKELGLNKYNGYSDTILKELIGTSTGSSADQLNFVLARVVAKRNTQKTNILNKIKVLLNDLEIPNSYLNEAIKDIPPLQFSS